MCMQAHVAPSVCVCVSVCNFRTWLFDSFDFALWQFMSSRVWRSQCGCCDADCNGCSDASLSCPVLVGNDSNSESFGWLPVASYRKPNHLAKRIYRIAVVAVVVLLTFQGPQIEIVQPIQIALHLGAAEWRSVRIPSSVEGLRKGQKALANVVQVNCKRE